MLRTLILSLAASVALHTAPAATPQRIILETDMGNDVDDVLALDMLYKYQDAGKIDLLLISNNKGNPYSVPFIHLLNDFYGYPDIPVASSPASLLPQQKQSKPGYPEVVIRSGAFPTADTTASDAVAQYRRTLAAQPDRSVVIVSIGFLSNLSRLLDSAPDAYSPLSGRDLVARKVRLLSLMGGNFDGKGMKEFNIRFDATAARKVFDAWPTPMIVSAWEIGGAIFFPGKALGEIAYTPHNPLPMAYASYLKMPYDRECWDQTAVLAAVEGTKGYFGLSKPGRISVDDAGRTTFGPSSGGHIRLLKVTPKQTDRVRDRIVQLVGLTPTKYQTRK